jgi:hypothetical protein
MREVVAAILAVLLLLVALALAGTLHLHRKRRLEARRRAVARGRRVVAELPIGADLTLFTEDDERFYLGDRAIGKRNLHTVRVLINGATIAAYSSTRFPASPSVPVSIEDRPEGIERDRWDVVIETTEEAVVVECGALRERVSQELARKIYDAVRRDIERRDEEG